MEPGAPGAAHWPGAPSRTGPSSSRGSPADQRQYRRTCVGNSETEEIPLRGRVRFPNGRGQLREAGTQERPPDNEGDLCQSARPSETCDRPGAAQSRSRGVRGDASGSDATASRAASPRRAGARGASARLGTNRGRADRNRIAIPRIVGRDCAEYPGRHDGGTVHRATPLEPGIARSKHRAEDAVDSAAAIDRRGDAGTVGGGVKIDGGLLDFEFLLGDAVIDLAGLALEAADDFLFGGFEAGAFDGETGVGEIGFILFGGDFGLGKGLIEGGLGLAEGGFLLHEGLVSAGGIEFDDGVGLFDAFTGRGHPGDAEVGDHGRVDLNGALGGELAAAADEDQEIALAGGGGGEDGGGLGLAVAVGGEGSGEGESEEKEEAGPEAEAGAGAAGQERGSGGWGDAGLGDGGIAHCLVSLAGASTTTAAERSGMRWGSDLSSLKTAVKVLIGLPSAEEATGLANSKWAGMARSG